MKKSLRSGRRNAVNRERPMPGPTSARRLRRGTRGRNLLRLTKLRCNPLRERPLGTHQRFFPVSDPRSAPSSTLSPVGLRPRKRLLRVWGVLWRCPGYLVLHIEAPTIRYLTFCCTILKIFCRWILCFQVEVHYRTVTRGFIGVLERVLKNCNGIFQPRYAG